MAGWDPHTYRTHALQATCRYRYRQDAYHGIHISCMNNALIPHSKTVPRCSPMHKAGNKLCIIYLLIYGSVKWELCLYVLNKYSKTVPRCSPMHKEGNDLCIMYPLIYGSVKLELCLSVLNKNSKTVLRCSPMHKEGNELCIIYLLIYGSVL